MIFGNQFRIRMKDIGIDGVATEKALMEILEEISIMHSESVGFGVKECMEQRKGWVLLDWNIEILKRPLYGDNVMAYTWARKNDKLVAYRDYEIKDTDGNIIVRGTSRWLLMNIDKKRPCRLDESISEKYGSEPDKIALSEEFVKIDFPEKVINNDLNENVIKEYNIVSEQYKVRRREIDFNQHMNNLAYLDIAIDIVPQEVYDRGFNRIRIEYKKEVKPTDTPICMYCKYGKKHLVIIKCEEKINCIVELENDAE